MSPSRPGDRPDGWPDDRPDGRLGSPDCERIRPGRIAQPVNTVTSIAFVAAAAVAIEAARRRGPERRTEVLAYSTLLALVGAGSVAFHGPQPQGAKWMHDLPIVGLVALATTTPLVRLSRGRTALPGWSPRRGVGLAVIGAASAAAWAGGRTSAPTCRPDSLVQLHGAWHLLAAAAFTLAADVLYAPVTGH
jgi:hypothetical protein